jgi:hypothetical protein
MKIVEVKRRGVMPKISGEEKKEPKRKMDWTTLSGEHSKTANEKPDIRRGSASSHTKVRGLFWENRRRLQIGRRTHQRIKSYNNFPSSHLAAIAIPIGTFHLPMAWANE